MKNLKNMLAAITMMAILVFGTTFANAGIIIAGAESGDSKTCGEGSKDGGFGVSGIIIAGIIIARTGIIIANAGIIIAKEDPNLTCGIIIADK
jgi:hypothetical protein